MKGRAENGGGRTVLGGWPFKQQNPPNSYLFENVPMKPMYNDSASLGK